MLVFFIGLVMDYILISLIFFCLFNVSIACFFYFRMKKYRDLYEKYIDLYEMIYSKYVSYRNKKLTESDLIKELLHNVTHDEAIIRLQYVDPNHVFFHRG